MTKPPGPPDLDQATRRALAVGLFNHTWTLLETHPRTPAQDDEMLHAPHASRYHWGEVSDDVHLARGEWQCARVYSVLGRAEPALWHARRCVELAEADPNREDWDLPAAYEAMARALRHRRGRGGGRRVEGEGDRGAGGHRRRRGPDAHRAGRRGRCRDAGRGPRLRGLPTPDRRPRMTDLKTGILLWSQGATWPEQLEAAQRVDRLGYDHLWTWDHLYAIFGDPYQPIFEGWSSLAAWAMATERTRLGLLVGANTFRNPGLVAKIAATARPHQRRPGDPRHRRGLDGARAPGARHRLRVRVRAAARLDGRVGRRRCARCSTVST